VRKFWHNVNLKQNKKIHDFFLNSFELAKWSDKKAMLDDFLISCTVPKIVPSNIYHIIALMKRIIIDPNINVVQSGIKILGQLAKGLRKNFSSAAKIFFPILLGKFKEKKSQIVEETHKTLDFFYFSLQNLDEIFEEIKIGLTDKVTHAKFNTLIFLERFLEKHFNHGKTLNFKKIGSVIKGLLEDGAAEIRDSALKLIVKLKIKGGETMNDLFSEISSNRMQKILEEEKKLMGINE
jgi:hypothetical protein